MSIQKTNDNQHTSRIKDIIIRSLAGVLFAFSAGASFRIGFTHLKGFDLTNPSIEVLGKSLSVFSIGLYGMMVAILYVVRLRTKSKSAGIVPSMAALLGAFMLFALLLIGPCENLPLWARILSSALLASGNVGAIVVLFWLGRSFSILPEGRKLITTGPYAIVRHPLYLIEAVGTLGTIINFWSWQAVLLFAAQIAMQFTRMHYEEKVLTKTFPEYADYAAQTRRVIPWIY
ncbi:isoprenylcysteine carboxylmethyltransferase family protein [Chlorobaculum sp. 24CR]|uniref:methyltransferase family protein n=1 Tax=Chlorobaculum sp. 24CR TaxID=2508878 RepID=UPI001432107C|nr:isoprenylcysteine carboxylmethyltransferase family protein [Chlorobaculum sp. 24CR]